jgi:wobble nucleotide-excising tRNase
MIKRIKSIKNLGIFNDYKIDGNLRDFNDKNIIYGWNYSGKTTLSRLFSFLDKENSITDEFSSIEFEVELTDTKKITHTNKAESPLSIKVFNSDFIRDNLRFESDDKKIKGITFDVGEGGEIRDKIKLNSDKIKKGELLQQKYSSNINAFNDFENKFTNEARKIKNDCFNSLIEFDKRHLKTVINSLTNDLNSYTSIDSTDLSKIKADALAQNPKQEIVIQIPELLFESILEEVKMILSSIPAKTEDDPILSFHSDLYDWTKQGYGYYQEKNPKLTKCAFCGSNITERRFEYLNAFYTNEAAKLKEKIATITSRINLEKQKIENLEWSKKSPNDLIESCQHDFSELINQYSIIKANYLSLLDILLSKLEEKDASSLFVEMPIGHTDNIANTNFTLWISNVKKIFEQHNITVSQFTQIRDTARDTYKKYLVATFLINEHYYDIQRNKEIEDRFQTRCSNIIKKYEDENKTLNAQLKSLTKGKEKLNEFIRIFLNREDILVDVTTDDYFILKRGNNIAKNLSEGEKTAIAFSHFMVMLDSLLTDNKLQETIIFIDDPISSLDANHIAQVSSTINSFFFRKGLDSTNPDKVVNCFKQLFISTHNFEFYSFLKDANNIKKKKKIKANEAQEESSCHFYLLKRLNKEQTLIQSMPKSLSKYNSEYVYLFSEIEQFKIDNYPEDKSYSIPNIVRRFLEIYTLIKLPGNSDEVDNRVKILIGDVNELKILHNFSHFTTFERVTKHNELVFKLEDVIMDLFKLLEKDKEHLHSLYKGIGKSIQR